MDFVQRIASAITETSPRVVLSDTGRIIDVTADDEVGSIDYERLEFDFSDLRMTPDPSRVVNRISKTVKSKKDQVRSVIEARRKHLREELKKPPNMRLKDKLSFTLGVGNVGLTMFLLGAAPGLFYKFYAVKLPFLMFLRFYLYRKSKWHYFMLDFCYFANLLFALWLFVFPDNCTLFKACFAFSMGPLCWAIALWKNSMVFHSLDKITSLFIHLTPGLMLWGMKWFPADTHTVCVKDDTMTVMESVVYPTLIYCAWQFGYFIKVEVFDKWKFQQDPDYMTSFRWLTSDSQKRTLIYRLSNIYGPKYRVFFFGFFQLIFTIVTMAFVPIFYSYFWAQTIILFVMCLVSCWNGACFYIEVFSVRYQQSMMQAEKQYEELSKLIESPKMETRSSHEN